ncbi:MAG: hypothetical protein ACYTGX_16875 [Planctomycetota bacterium]
MTAGAAIDGGARVPGAAAGDPAVAIAGLRKSYGDVTALDGIDLQVPRGTASTCRCRAARCSASSAPTAPARPPR